VSSLPDLLQAPSLPSTAADELGGEHRRMRRLRLLLAVAAVALLAACLGLARDAEALPTTYFASGSGGIVVLDLSASVDQLKSQRVQRVLQALADTEGRAGLVVFSDSAYQMLPPDTRTEELRPLLRFFRSSAPAFGSFRGRRGGGGGGTGPRLRGGSAEDSPWSVAFRGGTKISTGLIEARRLIARERDPDLGVVLISDLDNSGFDTSVLTEELVRYQRQGIDLRVIPLFPAPEDLALFKQLVPESAFVERAELIRNSDVRERQTLVGAFPWPFLAAAAALLLLLAANERWCGRLAWRNA
jgi:hypothetical protein